VTLYCKILRWVRQFIKILSIAEKHTFICFVIGPEIWKNTAQCCLIFQAGPGGAILARPGTGIAVQTPALIPPPFSRKSSGERSGKRLQSPAPARPRNRISSG
jgi:hypothetical protein